jgi:POT family proton-dependent oligopeptide transporter
MFKGHPKGLFVAFFSNMGERFGFYTMMAILVLFLQAKYGLSEEDAGNYYSWFYFGIYALALVGGILADVTRKYKTVILGGIVVMFMGYVIMALPGNPLAITLTGLFTIAFGNGLFKGNLQAVVGQLYDNPKYSKVRDSAFMIFYMGINVGAFFAPFVATGIRNWYLKTQGFLHDGSLPAMCHAYQKGALEDTSKFQELADKVSGTNVIDLGTFAQNYVDAFSRGYNYAFGIAAGAMILSLLVYIIFNKLLPSVEKVVKTQDASKPKANTNLVSFLLGGGLMITTSIIFYFLFRTTVKDPAALGAAVGLFIGFVAIMFQVSTKEERPRVTSLIMVFVVVIFFWMSFHQNGLTLTFFARDYTVKEVAPFTNIFFNLESILAFIGAIAGLVLLFRKNMTQRIIGGLMFIILGGLTYYFITQYNALNPIAPEVFQSFNPLFIVSLTFPVMGIFAWLNKKNMEPSAPKKIGIGMIIAAIGFVIILIASLGLVSPHELQYVDINGVTKYNPVPDSSRVAPYWLISSYLILTIAELFLSPMGLSFVSKVAPPRFQGLMQGGWLLATAVGNKFLFVGSKFWGVLDLWQLWSIFIVCCILSAVFIFSIMKRLEAATK